MHRPIETGMKPHKFLHGNGLAAALSAAFLMACGSGGEAEPPTQAGSGPEKEYVTFGEYISETDSLPRLRYFESGLVSINDRCAVRKVKLNPKMRPAWVNGRPVGFC